MVNAALRCCLKRGIAPSNAHTAHTFKQLMSDDVYNLPLYIKDSDWPWIIFLA